MNQLEISNQSIQETIKRSIEEATEKKRIKNEIAKVDRELNNIFLFKEILGIRYIPAVTIINNGGENDGINKRSS